MVRAAMLSATKSNLLAPTGWHPSYLFLNPVPLGGGGSEKNIWPVRGPYFSRGAPLSPPTWPCGG